MTSEIRANTLKNRVGLGTVSFTDSGPVVSGIVTANTLRLPDSPSGSLGRVQLGNGLDLSLHHDGTNSHIINNTGYLTIQSQDGVNGIFIARNAEVNLYYGPSVRLQTSSSGVTINRDIDVDGHTNLDNVSIAGVTTAQALQATTGTFTGDVDIASTLCHSGDTDTKITFATNTIKFDTDTEERLRITSAGSVGINESSPDRKLHVRSDGAAAAKLGGESGAAYYMEIGQLASSGSPGFNATGSSTSMLFQLNGSEKVRIDSGGGLKFTGQGTSIPVGGILHHTNNNLYVRGGTNGLILGNNNNTTTVQIYNGYIKFETNDGTEKLRITSNGDMLLGAHGSRIFDDSSGTNVVVDIYGGTTAGKRGILALGGRTGSDDADIGTIQFVNENNNLATAANHVQSKLVASIDVKSQTTTSNSGANSGGHLIFSTKGENAAISERLRIDSSGNIRQVKTGANVSLTLSRNESVGTTNQALGVIDFASNTAHTVQARLMAKSLGTSNVGGDLIIETRAEGGSLDERVRFTGAGDVAIGRDAALANYADGSNTPTQLAVVKDGGAAGSGYHEVAHFTAGTDTNDTGAIVRITQFNNDRGLFIKAGRGSSDRAKALIGLRDSAGNDTNYLQISQNTDLITSHRSVDIDSGYNLSLGGTSNTHAPLHVKSENTSYGKNAIFGAGGWVNHASYHQSDANVTLLGRDLDGNDKGCGIEFTTRNTGNSNWLHGAITFGQDGFLRMFTGGAGTYVSQERLTIDNQGNLKQGTSTPTAFTGSAPNHTQRFLGKKCMQGSVTSVTTLDGSGNGTFDLGRLWITDDTSIELFIQVMRNDSTNYVTHYCKAFINKTRGTGMSQGHILYQNGAASGFSLSNLSSGGYTAGGGASHGTQIDCSGGAGGVIYRMTCFYTAISKNDMY